MDFFEELGTGLEDIRGIIDDRLWRILGAILILAVGWWRGWCAAG